MSEYIWANLQHAKDTVPYATNIFIHEAKMEAREAADYQGVNPHFLYRMHTRGLSTVNPVLVQQGDLVIDTNQATLDPKTGITRRYRIVSDPQPKALMMSWQWEAERERGT
jgi:hypothetical protein